MPANEITKKPLYDITPFELAVQYNKTAEPWSLKWWRDQGFQAWQINEKDYMGWLVATTILATAHHHQTCNILGNPNAPDRIFLELPPGGKYYEIRR